MYRIAILGNYATQFFHRSLKKQLKNAKIESTIYEGDFSSIDFEILNPQSGLYEFKPEVIIIHESDLAFRDEFYSNSSDLKSTFAVDKISLLKTRLNILKSNLPQTKVIYPLQAAENDNVFGNYYSKTDQSYLYQHTKYNWMLTDFSMNNNELYLINNESVSSSVKRDWTQVVNADLHFTPSYLDALAIQVVKVVNSLRGSFAKCIILDLDNTLWGGIIGDDGIEGIQIGSIGIGKAFLRLQKWIKQLKNRGIIVAVCSKNDDSVARNAFINHPEMVLKPDDIAIFTANWESKADNINNIQKVLNIGFDSMVFIDDNPAEREIVRKFIPEVIVPELPADPAEYLPYLISLNLFETTSYSVNDESRTKQYQEESKRLELANSITDINEYLKSLNMSATISNFEPVEYDRIAQLTQRSNQFNLRTQRYTISEIKEIAESDGYLKFAVTLKDKFGDYGLISLMIIKLDQSTSEAFLDTWLMSCRVLKRNVEELILNTAVDKLKNLGIKKLNAEYLQTAKNNMVSGLLTRMGFASKQNPHEYFLELDTFTPGLTHIQYENTN